MNNADISRRSKTDWQRVDTLQDREIDLSDCPEITDEMFAHAIVRKDLQPARRKNQVTLRLDAETLAWFKGQGRGYQTKINSILHAYMRGHKQHASKDIE